MSSGDPHPTRIVSAIFSILHLRSFQSVRHFTAEFTPTTVVRKKRCRRARSSACSCTRCRRPHDKQHGARFGSLRRTTGRGARSCNARTSSGHFYIAHASPRWQHITREQQGRGVGSPPLSTSWSMTVDYSLQGSIWKKITSVIALPSSSTTHR